MNNNYPKKQNNQHHNKNRNNNFHQRYNIPKFSEDASKIIETAEKNANTWILNKRKSKITKTQVRKFFAELKSIDLKYRSNVKDNFQNIKNDLVYLKPLLAYQSGRIGVEAKDFFKHLIDSINNVTNEINEEKYSKLIKYCEALIAYYIYLGGE